MHPYILRSTVNGSQDMGITYLSTRDEWIWKMWYIQRMGYYSAIEKNAIMAFATT